jgi:preprotein translocase subunit SecD
MRTLAALLIVSSWGCAGAPVASSPPVVVSADPSPPVVEPGPAPAPHVDRGVTLAIHEVDDEIDAFASLVSSMPREVSLEEETLWIAGVPVLTHFAEVTLQPGETLSDARSRLLRFVQGVSLPAGSQFGLQKTHEERGASRERMWAWRTFVVDTEAVITDEHLASATLRPGEEFPDGFTLQLVFNEEGTRLLSEMTERCLNRRIAMLLDGEVQIAPIVRSRIDGGRADVWLPPGTRVEDLPEAFASGVKIER